MTGLWSGSGQLVCDDWDILKTLWGSCPANAAISNSQKSLVCKIKNENNFAEQSKTEKHKSTDEYSPNQLPNGAKTANSWIVNKKPIKTVIC